LPRGVLVRQRGVRHRSRDARDHPPDRIAGYDRRRLDPWVAAICEEAGIDFVNLFDTFDATGHPNELYFPTPDPHWNEAGQLVAAEAVAERIEASLH
jgi:hypothetical protein